MKAKTTSLSISIVWNCIYLDRLISNWMQEQIVLASLTVMEIMHWTHYIDRKHLHYESVTMHCLYCMHTQINCILKLKTIILTMGILSFLFGCKVFGRLFFIRYRKRNKWKGDFYGGISASGYAVLGRIKTNIKVIRNFVESWWRRIAIDKKTSPFWHTDKCMWAKF